MGPGMGQASNSKATGRYADGQQPAISNASGNVPLPVPVNVPNAQEATGSGGMYVVNATEMGQGTGIPPPAGGQAASANVLATILLGLALQAKTAAPAAAPPMGHVLPQCAGGPIQMAQDAAPQLAMAPQQAMLQYQQPMPPPAPAVPAPSPPVAHAPRPLPRPLMQPVAQQQQQ